MYLNNTESEPPHLCLMPPLGVTRWNFAEIDIWHQKTRVLRLSYDIVCVILRLAVLIQYRRVTDRWTDT